MSEFDSDISAALLDDQPIPRKRVLDWIKTAASLSTLSKLYWLTGESYYRIQPDLGREATCELIQRYLLECIRLDVADDEEIEGRYEAAQSLHAWFCHLLETEDTSAVLAGAARAITQLYLASGEEVRNAIETGFLEHALETPALRPYFEHWSSDARLHSAWDRALEWGKAHPDFVRGLLQELRKASEK